MEKQLFNSSLALEQNFVPRARNEDVQFSLYVVEDLSRDVIEVLGSNLSIEPSFFRAHIVDYAWYNVRDRWRDPPILDVVGRRQNWVQVRYVTARYFETSKDFDKASNEAGQFNILRRPDDDLSNKSWWDEKNAVVGLTRSRATFWLQPGHTAGELAVGEYRDMNLTGWWNAYELSGVLLLDPTVDSGIPLWRGRRNWYPTPPPNSEPSSWLVDPPPEPNKFYDDFLWWAQHPEVFSTSPTSTRNIHVPMQALLHLICSEWRTMTDYIKTRLCQIDLGLCKPQWFAANPQIELEVLNMWRRFIPLYREMISEALEQVFRFPCHTETFDAAIPEEEASTPQPPGNGEPNNAVLSSKDSTRANIIPSDQQSCSYTPPKTPRRLGSIAAYRNDFVIALSSMEEYQRRIDRLTEVVTAAIQIADSRRALNDARNLGRLTWLATVFIPFNLIASILSMQLHAQEISGDTVKLYFEVSLPLVLVTSCVAWVLAFVAVRR